MAREISTQEIKADNLQQFRNSHNNKNITYKNILPKQNITEYLADSDITLNAEYQTFERPDKTLCEEPVECDDKQANKMDETWEMYLAYAKNALANLATKNCDSTCTETEANAQTSPEPELICNQTVDVEIKAQLDRMEAMLREIHCFNQQFYDSLLEYCTRYENDNNNKKA